MASGDITEGDENKEISDKTIEIFECFIETQLEIDRDRNALDPGTPGLPPEELPHAPENRDDVAWQIGKKLADLADTMMFDVKSKELINEIVQLVNVGPNDNQAFEDFSDIARRMMSNGITWQNVATLFYFGYCIARERLTQGIQHFLYQLLKWIVNVFRNLGIFEWIASQGGWNDFLGYNPTDDSNRAVWVYRTAVVGIVAFICVLVYRKYASK